MIKFRVVFCGIIGGLMSLHAISRDRIGHDETMVQVLMKGRNKGVFPCLLRSSDMERYLLTFLSMTDHMRMKGVSRGCYSSITMMSEYELTERDYVVIDIIERIRGGIRRNMVYYTLSHDLLGYAFFREHKRLSTELGMQLIKSYPIFFLSSMYNTPYIWYPWLHKLPEQKLIYIYRVCDKYRGVMCPVFFVQNMLANYNLISDYKFIFKLMSINPTYTLVSNFFKGFNSFFNKEIVYKPIGRDDMSIVKQIVEVLCCSKYFGRYSRYHLVPSDILYLILNLVLLGEGRLASHFFCCIMQESSYARYPMSLSMFIKKFKKIHNDEKSPYRKASGHMLGVLDRRKPRRYMSLTVFMSMAIVALYGKFGR